MLKYFHEFEGIPIKVGTIDRHEVHGNNGSTFLCGKWCFAMATFYCFFMLSPHRVQEVLYFGVDTVIANECLYLWRYL